MVADFAVEVVRIADVRKHPDADALDVVLIEGKQLQTIAKRGQYAAGDKAVYVPYDAMIPDAIAEQWGVANYLSKGRVRAVRLRGEMSYGFLTDLAPGVDSFIGEDLADLYGITKYEPPPSFATGDSERDHPQFHRYTTIENLRHFPDVFLPGEKVVVTEKLHGTNARVGLVCDQETGEPLLVCGSHNLRKKVGQDGIYESPLKAFGVNDLLARTGTHRAPILFGEVYGWKVQDLHYGRTPQNALGFSAFDMSLGGTYRDHNYFAGACDAFGVERVPELYRGPYDAQVVAELSSGQTTWGGDHIREGIVVKPLCERTDPRIGRVILKLLNDDYLTRKGGTEAK
jgi:RNA ligase (TIGR02306 family)